MSHFAFKFYLSRHLSSYGTNFKMSDSASLLSASLQNKYSPYGIYRTPIAQALQRPVYEAPDFDMVGTWDDQESVEAMEVMKTVIPNPTLRCEYLDLVMEGDALEEYRNWAGEVAAEAALRGDRERGRFYGGLCRALKVDGEAVDAEYEVKCTEVFGEGWEDSDAAESIEQRPRSTASSNNSTSRSPSVVSEPLSITCLLPLSASDATFPADEASHRSQSQSIKCCAIL